MRGFLRIAAVILAAALALRVIGLGRSELWHDECCSVLMTTYEEGVWSAASRTGGGPDAGNPPLYFLALDGWTNVFGLSVPALRSLSLLASMVSLGALALLARALDGSRRATLWALAVAAVSPVHVFYATEARAYSLLLLLVTVAAWTFVRAVRAGDARWWAGHGAALAAAWYTHNLAVPWTAALWIAAPLLGATRRAWAGLAATHALVVAAFLPWAPVLAQQTGGGAHEWIRAWWAQTSPAVLIPRTLEVFGVGGLVPEYLPLSIVSAPVRWLSILGFAAAAFALFLPVRGSPVTGRRDELGPRRRTAALGVLLLVPLVFLLAYSALKAPLYLLGRYDLLAQPPHALLAGLGFARWHQRGGPFAAAAIGAWGLLLTFFAHRDVLQNPALSPPLGEKGARGEILEALASPQDAVVCTGFTTSEVWTEIVRRGLHIELITFPATLRTHVGWYDPDAELARGEETLREEAEAILDRIRGSERRNRTLWLFYHPNAGGAHQRVMNVLWGAMQESGCNLTAPPGQEEMWNRVGAGGIVCAKAEAESRSGP